MFVWREVISGSPNTPFPVFTRLTGEAGISFCWSHVYPHHSPCANRHVYDDITFTERGAWIRHPEEETSWFDRYGNDSDIHSTFLPPSHWCHAHFCEPPPDVRIWILEDPVMDEKGDCIGVTQDFWSEERVRRDYYPWWSERVRGVGRIHLLETEDQGFSLCLEDFINVNYAIVFPRAI